MQTSISFMWSEVSVINWNTCVSTAGITDNKHISSFFRNASPRTGSLNVTQGYKIVKYFTKVALTETHWDNRFAENLHHQTMKISFVL